MAIAFVAQRGIAGDKTAGTTISVNPTATIAAGRLLLVRCISTNDAGVDGEDTNQHSISDSKGNSYTKIKEFTAGGAIANQSQTSLFMSKLATALLTSDTVTLTTAASETVRVIAIEECSIGAGSPVLDGVAVNNQNTASPSVTLSGLANVEHFWVGILGVSTTTAESVTQAAGYANGSQAGTSGGSATSNRKTWIGTRVLTATSDTFSPTLGTSRRVVSILAALSETAVTVVDVTKGGTYRVQFTTSPTKGGTYRTLIANQAVTKGGTYRMLKANNDLDLAAIYRIVLEDNDIDKSAAYSVQPFVDVLKAAIYRIIQTFDVTQLGEYRILIAAQDVLKTGTFRILIADQDKTKAGEYRIIQTFDVALSGQYAMQPTFTITKAGAYRMVGQTPEIDVPSEFRVLIADNDVVKGGTYRIVTVTDLTFGGEHRVLLADNDVIKLGLYRMLLTDNDVVKGGEHRVLLANNDQAFGGEYRTVVADNDFMLVGMSRVRVTQSLAALGRYVLVGEAIEKINLTLPLDEQAHAPGDVEKLRVTLSLQEPLGLG